MFINNLIINQDCKNIHIMGTEFKNNYSQYNGGAICFSGCRGRNTIKNCLFKENSSKKTYKSDGGGGAISLKVSLNLYFIEILKYLIFNIREVKILISWIACLLKTYHSKDMVVRYLHQIIQNLLVVIALLIIIMQKMEILPSILEMILHAVLFHQTHLFQTWHHLILNNS